MRTFSMMPWCRLLRWDERTDFIRSRHHFLRAPPRQGALGNAQGSAHRSADEAAGGRAMRPGGTVPARGMNFQPFETEAFMMNAGRISLLFSEHKAGKEVLK
jgi:hypothetical protein